MACHRSRRIKKISRKEKEKIKKDIQKKKLLRRDARQAVEGGEASGKSDWHLIVVSEPQHQQLESTYDVQKASTIRTPNKQLISGDTVHYQLRSLIFMKAY